MHIIRLFDSLVIKEDTFVRTAPVFDGSAPKVAPSEPIMNPQTTQLCEKLGIDDPVQVVLARMGRTMKKPFVKDTLPESNAVVNTLVVDMEPSKSMIDVPVTPVKCQMSKLSLPAPITPSDNESEISSKNILSPETDTTSVSDSTHSSHRLFYECKTPSAAPKKTFKRRNVSIYNTPDADLSGSTDSSSMVDTDSPHTSKVPCRNMS